MKLPRASSFEKISDRTIWLVPDAGPQNFDDNVWSVRKNVNISVCADSNGLRITKIKDAGRLDRSRDF